MMFKKNADPLKKRHKFGRIRMGNRVGFVGLMVVGGWMCFFFAHSDFRVGRIPELHSA